MKTLFDLEQEIDRVASRAIETNYPQAWDENHITYDLLRLLQGKLRKAAVHDFESVIQVDAQGYKYQGPLETRYGDIAIRFAIAYADGTRLTGRAYMEAKRRDPKRRYYTRLNPKQIERLINSAPRVQLLLYEPDAISALDDGTSRTQTWTDANAKVRLGRPINAVVVPGYLYLVVRKRNSSLYKHGHSLGRQFARRFLYGLDLHYETVEESDFETHAKRQQVPNFLLSVSVAHGDAELPQLPKPFEGEVTTINDRMPTE